MRFLAERAACGGGAGTLASIRFATNDQSRQWQFISKALDAWEHRHGVKLEFSRPGKPTDNAFIEASTVDCAGVLKSELVSLPR